MAKSRLMMLGPPGAGKGTQAQQIVEEFELPHISTGDMLRGARQMGSELGLEAARYMDAGDLVPDEVVIGLVAERLAENDARTGFILDGFPRTVKQAEALRAMNVELDVVLSIVVAEDELIRRLGGRLSCPACGASFHDIFHPPKKQGVCDECAQSLVRREDDKPEAVHERLKAYRAKTEPLTAFYRDLGILREVNGQGAPDEVYARIRAEIIN